MDLLKVPCFILAFVIITFLGFLFFDICELTRVLGKSRGCRFSLSSTRLEIPFPSLRMNANKVLRGPSLSYRCLGRKIPKGSKFCSLKYRFRFMFIPVSSGFYSIVILTYPVMAVFVIIGCVSWASWVEVINCFNVLITKPTFWASIIKQDYQQPLDLRSKNKLTNLILKLSSHWRIAN